MPRRRTQGFTLIELLVVISIIIILMGLLFPAFRGAQDQAKKVQAKNDLSQVVNAVNSYYTEYGKYPVAADDVHITNNADLVKALLGKDPANNTRLIVFMNVPDVKDRNNPRSGVGSDSQFYDPWGTPYRVEIDGDYDNELDNPYTADTGAGPNKIRQGVIAWSIGKDLKQGTDFKKSDDVISWQ